MSATEDRMDILRKLQSARNDAIELPDGTLFSVSGEDLAYRIQVVVIDYVFSQAEQDSTGIDNTRVDYLRAGGERTGAKV